MSTRTPFEFAHLNILCERCGTRIGGCPCDVAKKQIVEGMCYRCLPRPLPIFVTDPLSDVIDL